MILNLTAAIPQLEIMAATVFQVLQLGVCVVTQILNTKIVYGPPLDGASVVAASQSQAERVPNYVGHY